MLLDIVQNLGANYIQMVYDSSTAYATALFHALQTEVTTNDKYKICIAQSIPTTPHDSVSQYVYIMDTLRIKSSAKVVLVLLHTEEINKVMDAILPLLTPEDNFLFLASESWGRRQKIIQGRTKLEGSLILSQEIAVDQLFQRYFAELDPSESMNPWLQHFWEVRFNCYMDKSFYRKGKMGPCPEHFAENYEQDSRVPFHIQAVYALVKGFDAALKQHCGPGATSTCESLTSSRLVSAMHEVLLDLYSTGRMSAVFDDNGDGLVGYNVLKVSLDLSMPEADDVVYEDVSFISVCLSVSLSLFVLLSLCFCLSLSTSLCFLLSLSLSLSMSLCVCLSVCLSVCFSFCSSLCLCLSVSLTHSLCLSVSPPISFSLSVFISLFLSLCFSLVSLSLHSPPPPHTHTLSLCVCMFIWSGLTRSVLF